MLEMPQERIDVMNDAERKARRERAMNSEQITHMVDRFLGWRLPDNFHPDGGISFVPTGNAGTPHEYTRNPVGTNLLDATQAEEMIRYLIDGIPPSTIIKLARAAISPPRWSLADGPCWCNLKRADAARSGTKIHSNHCEAMKSLSNFVFNGGSL
jgi:hypothetical protein